MTVHMSNDPPCFPGLLSILSAAFSNQNDLVRVRAGTASSAIRIQIKVVKAIISRKQKIKEV